MRAILGNMVGGAIWIATCIAFVFILDWFVNG